MSQPFKYDRYDYITGLAIDLFTSRKNINFEFFKLNLFIELLFLHHQKRQDQEKG